MDISDIWKFALMLCLGAFPAFAQDRYSCAGSDPDWTLEIMEDSASFSFVEIETLNIPHQTTAPNRIWPKALTLLGGRDTAIVILNERKCSTAEITNYPIEANILTQKSETPVILTGCCITP